MQVQTYELRTHKALDTFKDIAAVTIETISAEIQILNLRNTAGELRGIEIDASLIGIYIIDETI